MGKEHNITDSWTWTATPISMESEQLAEPKQILAKHDWFWIIFVINFFIALHLCVLLLLWFVWKRWRRSRRRQTRIDELEADILRRYPMLGPMQVQ
ncbi:hypothetical protein Y032_0487g2350 [Ancylostoma ceylanicum]|uniref:Uncharacterized protein n=1 Tax=Ancylostoma ceylanicum TaxID=53326 RepID=A0A016WWK5_9BILA|nr:hypothetical protein Y032_0487g2350 [Ancylostoma ceylanicum]